MKTFKQTHLTKRFLAIILSLIFALSSFTIVGFVPTMDALAEEETVTLDLTTDICKVGITAVDSNRYSGSGQTATLNIVNDQEDGNFSIGYVNIDISAYSGKIFKSFPLTFGKGANSDSESQGLKFWYTGNTNADGYTTNGKINNDSNVTGTENKHLEKAVSYYGLTEIATYTRTQFDNDFPVTIDVAEAANATLERGGTHLVIMITQPNSGQKSSAGGWTDTKVTFNKSQTCQIIVEPDPNAPVYVDTVVYKFNGADTTFNGTNTPYLFTDNTNSTYITGAQWGSTASNNSGGYVTVDNATISSVKSDSKVTSGDAISGVDGEYWSISMKYQYNYNDNASVTLFGIGSHSSVSTQSNGQTQDASYMTNGRYGADLIQVCKDGGVYVNGSNSSFATISGVQSSDVQTITFKYEKGTIKVLLNNAEKASIDVSANKDKFEAGPGNFFVGTSAANLAGGTWHYVGRSNTSNAIHSFKLYEINGIKTTEEDPEPPAPVDPDAPDTDDSITRPDYSLLETAISNYEDVLATKLTSDNKQLVNAADGFKVYINAKAVLDKAKYGYGIDQSVVDDLTTKLNAAKNVLNLTASYFTSKAKDYKANYWSTPFNSTVNLNNPSNYYSNVAYTITDNNESGDALVRDYNGYQGRIKYVLPNNVCIYTGTNIMFPVMFGYTRNDYWYYHNFSSDVVNVSLDDRWKWRNSTGSTDYAWQNNSPEDAMSSSTSNSTTYQSADGASNTVYRYYSNRMYMSPKNSTDALIKVTSLTSNVSIKVNQVNNYVVKAIKIGSGQDANFNFGIYILNYKYLTDTLSGKAITNKFSTKDDVLSLIQNTDVNDAAMLKYLTAYQDANNFIPYKVGGVDSGTDISQSANYSTAWSTIEANATKMTGIINNLTDAYNALTKDTDYNTLRTYITQYADIDSNDQCYSNYANYKVARNTARAAISAAADKYLTDGTAVFNTKYDEVDIITIANNLKAERALVIAGKGEHLYKTQGILNKDDRTITYECFRDCNHDKYIVTDKAEAYISAIESLAKEMSIEGKYTDSSVAAAQTALNNNSFTTEQGSEKEEIKVNFTIDDLTKENGILDTYTTNILTAITNLKARTNLSDATVTYQYITNNDENNIISGKITKVSETEELKYGDVLRDSYHTLGTNEHVVKWTAEYYSDAQHRNQIGSTLNYTYNPTTNLNIEARNHVLLTCYIETDVEEDNDEIHTVQFIDKAGRVRAIAYATSSDVFTVDSYKVLLNDKVVFTSDILPFYDAAGVTIGKNLIETGTTFTVSGDTNVYSAYKTKLDKIVINVNGKDKKLNGKPIMNNKYEAAWDELISITADDNNTVFVWYIDGVPMSIGNNLTFRANETCTIEVTNQWEYKTPFVTDYIGTTKVDYFNYDVDLNRVTCVVSFNSFGKRTVSGTTKEYFNNNENVVSAGVYLSTKASDQKTILETGKKFASNTFTSLNNQAKITVSRTAKTAFTMYAVPYVTINENGVEKTYYGDVKSTHYAGENA